MKNKLTLNSFAHANSIRMSIMVCSLLSVDDYGYDNSKWKEPINKSYYVQNCIDF